MSAPRSIKTVGAPATYPARDANAARGLEDDPSEPLRRGRARAPRAKYAASTSAARPALAEGRGPANRRSARGAKRLAQQGAHRAACRLLATSRRLIGPSSSRRALRAYPRPRSLTLTGAACCRLSCTRAHATHVAALTSEDSTRPATRDAAGRDVCPRSAALRP